MSALNMRSLKEYKNVSQQNTTIVADVKCCQHQCNSLPTKLKQFKNDINTRQISLWSNGTAWPL